MDISPEQKAFIQGEVKEKAAAAASEKTVDVERPQKPPALPRNVRRANRRTDDSAPDVSEVLDQVLVPVTVRLPRRMAHALKRACLEQQLKHAKPGTQQEIVELALGDWLGRYGYYD